MKPTNLDTAGEFPTPKIWANEAHKYIEFSFGKNWKEDYIVWDCACGGLNLTKDYNFKELYCSTLNNEDYEKSELINSSGYKFKYDFLNDSLENLPHNLKKAIDNKTPIVIFINPPYATAGTMGATNDHKESVGKNSVNKLMIESGMGRASMNLYAQFLFRILEIVPWAKICIFCPPLFLSGSSFKNFRKKMFKTHSFKNGFLFKASHFTNVTKDWGVSFVILENLPAINKSSFELDTIDLNETTKHLEKTGTKKIYNTDFEKSASKFVKVKSKNKIYAPILTSATNIKTEDVKNTVKLDPNFLGYFDCKSNNVYYNDTRVALYSSAFSDSCGSSITAENFYETTTLFTARRAIMPNWLNCKDEYLCPDETHEKWLFFKYNSLVYSIFNNMSLQSSLKDVVYKEKTWNIKNEFFWMSKNEIKKISEESSINEDLNYNNNKSESFLYKELYGTNKVYSFLCEESKEILLLCTDMLKNTFKYRPNEEQSMNLMCWDAGYAQLKNIWKKYDAENFKKFKQKYKELEEKLKPIIYEVGFLKN